MDDAPEVVTLVDEEGAEQRFRLHDAFELDGTAYYLVEAEAEPEMVLLLREGPDGFAAVQGEEFDEIMRMLEEDEDAAE